MRSFAWVGFAVTLGLSTFAAQGCSSGGNRFDGGPDNDSGDNTGDESDLITDSGGGNGDSLTVVPMNPTLNATGTPVTQQFMALVTSTMQQDPNAQWSLDNVALGAVDSMGLFTAFGNVGGVATIDANDTQLNAKGSTTVTVDVVVTENPGNVSMGDQTKLKMGGNADSSFRWLYPYNKTVWPRGLAPALMQFDGNGATAVMVHLHAAHIDYTGFFGGSTPTRTQLSAKSWNAVLASVGASDPLMVEVTKLNGGAVTGPIKETWTVAQGALRGTVYYNTYNGGGGTGATLKLKPGQMSSQFIGNCNVCHSVSANGNVMAASYGHQYGVSWDLTKAGPPMIKQGADSDYEFPALYPDGSLALTTYGEMIPGVWNMNAAHLEDIKSGNNLGGAGIDSYQPQMPSFSPDGKFLVFNPYAGGGRTISMMSFDVKTKMFSKKVDLTTDNSSYPGWPIFTPDSGLVLYHTDSASDYATWSGNTANVSAIEVATKKVTTCDALNGIANGQPYLPYTTQETNYNFEPTIVPIAVGGYYWAVFTSRRYYGNTVTPSTNPQPSDPVRKKLWIAAIDINHMSGKDPSHPAFYLDGQDPQAGSLRGFWVLDPCKPNGQSCESGDECCGGFCRQVTLPDGGIGKQCVPPPMGCHQEFEICTTAADCCNMGSLCINGHCATPPPT